MGKTLPVLALLFSFSTFSRAQDDTCEPANSPALCPGETIESRLESTVASTKFYNLRIPQFPDLLPPDHAKVVSVRIVKYEIEVGDSAPTAVPASFTEDTYRHANCSDQDGIWDEVLQINKPLNYVNRLRIGKISTVYELPLSLSIPPSALTNATTWNVNLKNGGEYETRLSVASPDRATIKIVVPPKHRALVKFRKQADYFVSPVKIKLVVDGTADTAIFRKYKNGKIRSTGSPHLSEILPVEKRTFYVGGEVIQGKVGNLEKFNKVEALSGTDCNF